LFKISESSLQPFGRWITSFDWSDIFTTNECEDKYGKFNDIMSDMIDILLPLKKTKVTKYDNINYFLMMFLIAMTLLKYLTVSFLVLHHILLLYHVRKNNWNVPGEYLIGANKVYNELRKTRTNKSPGPDMIPNKILKVFAYELAPVITDIYNSSHSGCVSDEP
jgi:hypothetical protein